MQTDELALKKAQRGDPDAFEKLIRPYESRMYAVAMRMMKSEEDARDVCQDALIRIYRALPNFKGNSAVSTWIHRIVTNLCLDELRRRANVTASLESMAEVGEQLVSREESPEARSERAEMRTNLEHAIRRLPDAQRTVIVMRDIEGFSYEEIATMLSLNLNTVKSRISRARGQLRVWLEDAEQLTTSRGCVS